MIAEVYESDIDRVALGQAVKVVAENGGFNGILEGSVTRIVPQVRQRNLLSTDPTGDADTRIIEVRIELKPQDAKRVSTLTGLKVIVNLQP